MQSNTDNLSSDYLEVVFLTEEQYNVFHYIWDSSMRSCDGGCSESDIDENLDCKCTREYDATHIKVTYFGKVKNIPTELLSESERYSLTKGKESSYCIVMTPDEAVYLTYALSQHLIHLN